MKPWEMFSAPVEPDEPPLPVVATPPAEPQQAAPPQPDLMDKVGDVAMAIPSAVPKGVAQGIGAGGDVRDLVMAAADKVGVVSPETIQKAMHYMSYVLPQMGLFSEKAPTSQEVQSSIENNLTGKLYEPTTAPGKIVGSAVEAAANPLSYLGAGSMGVKMLQALGSGTGSEMLGQVFEGKDGEGVARIIGALIGGYAPKGVSRAITPNPIDPDRQAEVSLLRREGIQPTAGQATGSKALQYAESYLGDAPLSGKGATHASQEAGQQFAQAALGRAGESAARATPDVIDDAFTRLGQKMDSLAANNEIQFDLRFYNEINRARTKYNDLFLYPMVKPVVENAWTTLFNQINANLNFRTPLPGAAYQNTREMLSRMQKSSDPGVAEFGTALRKSYDDVMERSIARLNPADLGEWKRVRRQYGNLIPIARAASVDAEGTITPQKMRMALEAQNRRNYQRGRGDLNRLTRAGNTVLSQLPNSGTAQRLGMTGGIGALGALTGDDWQERATRAGLSMVGTGLAGRALMNRQVQRGLANQAMSNVIRRMPNSRYRSMVGIPSDLNEDEEE